MLDTFLVKLEVLLQKMGPLARSGDISQLGAQRAAERQWSHEPMDAFWRIPGLPGCDMVQEKSLPYCPPISWARMFPESICEDRARFQPLKVGVLFSENCGDSMTYNIGSIFEWPSPCFLNYSGLISTFKTWLISASRKFRSLRSGDICIIRVTISFKYFVFLCVESELEDLEIL